MSTVGVCRYVVEWLHAVASRSSGRQHRCCRAAAAARSQRQLSI